MVRMRECDAWPGMLMQWLELERELDQESKNAGSAITLTHNASGAIDDLEAGDTITAARRRRARRLLKRKGIRDAERKGREERSQREAKLQLPKAAMLQLVPIGAAADI